MIIAGIDFETSGLLPQTDRVIEVGAVLWDTNEDSQLWMISDFVIDSTTPDPLDPEITRITGITNEMLRKYGKHPIPVFSALNDMIYQSEAVVAHFGTDFDKKFYEAEMQRHELKVCERTWIDTAIDLPFPEHIKTRNLMHLAAEHGFLNPFPHRAVYDVLTMLKIFECYDAKAALEYARQPIVIAQALVSFDDREKAKARSYQWNQSWAPGMWAKRMRLPDFQREETEAPFKVRSFTKG